MIIKPMVRSNICINAHPKGCAALVKQWVDYVKKQRSQKSGEYSFFKPKNVLVLGCSTGYGLASRISAAFGYDALTIGVSYEKEGSETKGGTPGWYNNLAFDKLAKENGLVSETYNLDAFSDEAKKIIIDAAKARNIKFDLIVYSLASPVRTDPETGVLYKSVLKPTGKSYTGKTVDPFTCKITEITAEPATEEEIANTVKVMGGEDWERWIKMLNQAGVLEKGCKTVAYSYIGPELSQAIYRNGSIGMAKNHLEKTSLKLNEYLKEQVNGESFVSVNKGLVTRSSAVIPIIPIYLAVLFKVMKAKGTHEGCIEQMERLFRTKLYNSDNKVPVDSEHRIRIDDWEMDEGVQKEVLEIMDKITEDNIAQLSDLEGYKKDFLNTNGFAVDGVDYEEDVPKMNEI